MTHAADPGRASPTEPLRLPPGCVFLVRSPDDATVLLAVAPHLHGAELRWHDTLRGRAKRGRLVLNEPERAVFEAADGRTYTLERLTLSVYEREVRAELEGRPRFSDDESMHRFFTSRFSR